MRVRIPFSECSVTVTFIFGPTGARWRRTCSVNHMFSRILCLNKHLTENLKPEPRLHEKETSRWLFLRQSALPTTGCAHLRALLPLHGLSEAHRQRIRHQCDHRNFSYKTHTRGAGSRPGSPC